MGFAPRGAGFGIRIPNPNSQITNPESRQYALHPLCPIGYFILIIGAGLALWQAGVLACLSTTWILISAIIAVGLGVVLAVTSVRPTTITRE